MERTRKMKEVAHLGHAWRAGFCESPGPSRTSLTRPQGGFLLYYICLQVERDDRMSVEVAVCSTVVMNMGLSMEQGLGRHLELYHGGGSL
jgi:hypothetical protein